MHTVSWWGKLRGKNNSKFCNPDGRIVLEWILKKSFGKTWIEFIWLRIGISDKAVVNAVMNFRIA